MAEHIGQPTRSRRFIKLYLSTWALLASGALAYLAVLTFPPIAEAPAPQTRVRPAKDTSTEASEVKIRQVKTTEAKALTEVQGNLNEIRKDVPQLQEAAGESVAQPRPNSQEERVSAVVNSQEQPAATPGPTPTTKVPGISLLPMAEPRPVGDPPFRPAEELKAVTPPQPASPIETGSIPKPEIVFGEAVVTRSDRPQMAVQLAAGPSLQAMRQSWEQLSDRFGMLTALQPRVVAPREEGGAYRLLAGPLPTKADAVRICSQLGIGSKACFAAEYTGAPL